MMSGCRLVARTVPAALQSGPGASPRALGGDGVCASRVRSRRVWRTLQQNHNESVFFTCWQRWRPMGKKFKCTFLENLSSDFRKISHERAPRTDLPNCIPHDPPPKLGAEPGGRKFGGDPPKISHFRFPGVEIFTTVSSAAWSLHKLGV